MADAGHLLEVKIDGHRPVIRWPRFLNDVSLGALFPENRSVTDGDIGAFDEHEVDPVVMVVFRRRSSCRRPRLTGMADLVGKHEPIGVNEPGFCQLFGLRVVDL
jgi:hypothetical protein